MTDSKYMMYWFKPHRLENLNYTFLEHVWLMTAMGTVGLMIIMLILEIPPLKKMVKKFRAHVYSEREAMSSSQLETYVKDDYCLGEYTKTLMVERV